MKKEEVWDEPGGNYSITRVSMETQLDAPLAARKYVMGQHNLKNVRGLNQDYRTDYASPKPPIVVVHLFPVRDGIAIEIRGQHIILPLEQEAISPVHNAIISLRTDHRLGVKINSDEQLLQKHKEGIEILKQLLLNSWSIRGSLKSKRQTIELVIPGKNLEEDWTPQTVADLFGGGVNAAMVRYYARQLAKIPIEEEKANFPLNDRGEPQTWNFDQMTRLVNHMSKYCPTARKIRRQKKSIAFRQTQHQLKQ